MGFRVSLVSVMRKIAGYLTKNRSYLAIVRQECRTSYIDKMTVSGAR